MSRRKPYQSPFNSLAELKAYPIAKGSHPSSVAHKATLLETMLALFPGFEDIIRQANKPTKAQRDKLITFTNSNSKDLALTTARWNVILYLDGFEDIELIATSFQTNNSVIKPSCFEASYTYSNRYNGTTARTRFAETLQTHLKLNNIKHLTTQERDVAYLLSKHYSRRQIALLLDTPERQVRRIRRMLQKILDIQ